jgi:hypothetical protein
LLRSPTINPVACSNNKGRNPSLDGPRVDLLPLHPEQPHEPTADGCPGGWYRTAYVNSVARYTRRRTGDGGRVPNPFFDRASWQVQEAVMQLELEQERFAVHRIEANHEAMERKRKRDAAARKGRGRHGARR